MSDEITKELKVSDSDAANVWVEQARVRLERAVAEGAGKQAQAALAALTSPVIEEKKKSKREE